MNYQHAYHAGNFADVVKHTLLIQLLEQFCAKQKPFYALDAYGGRGLYSLASVESQKTAEADSGIAKLLAQSHANAPMAVQKYLDLVAHAKRQYDKYAYPGSPWIMAQYSDFARAEAFEKVASQYDALNYQLYQLPIGIHHRDAFEGVPAVIPPKERRGLVLLDPPFEKEHKDFGVLADLLAYCHKKWQNGTFALWYPIKNISAVEVFSHKMRRMGFEGQLICELCLYPTDVAVGLNGTGLYVLNPPYQFDIHAKSCIDYLAKALQIDSIPTTTKVQWLVPPR